MNRYRQRAEIRYEEPPSRWSAVEWVTNAVVLVVVLWSLIAAFMNYGGTQ